MHSPVQEVPSTPRLLYTRHTLFAIHNTPEAVVPETVEHSSQGMANRCKIYGTCQIACSMLINYVVRYVP